jgi:hypothetical protein
MSSKRLASLFFGIAAAVLFSTPAWAAQKTWTGKISDSTCGAKHKTAMEHGGKKMTDAECTKACVKAGAQYVFVHEGKVIPIANQDFSGLEEHAGHTVHLTGEMNAGNITVSKIVMPTPAKKTGAKNPS